MKIVRRGMQWLAGAVMALALCLPSLVQAIERLSAAPGDPAAWPVVLHAHLEAYEDQGNAATLTEVAALPPLRWRATGGLVPSFGFSHSAWWLRVRLINPTGQALERVVELPQPVQDLLEFHAVEPGKAQPIVSYRTGDRRSFDTRPVAYPGFVFPLQLAPHQQLDLYVRLATYDGLHEAAPLLLWDHRSFFESSADERLGLGLYYGALLALLLYNLFLFASTREWLFAEYVAYLAAFFVWNFTFRGHAFQYWWPTHPDFNNQVLAFAAGLCFVTHSVFTMHYLQTRQLAPRLHALLKALFALQCLSLLPPLAGIYAMSWMFMIPLSLVSLATFMVTAAVLLRRGSRSARYYLLAWSVLEVGVMLYYLRLVGLLPSSFVTEQALQIGSALEFVLLAFGLADRMNELKAAKLEAERAALAAQNERQLAHTRAELEREKMRNVLVHAGKLATVGRMASGVIHELSHPVGAMALSLGALDTLLAQQLHGQAQALVPEITHEVARIRALIQRLRNMARSDPPRLALHDLATVLKDARQLFGSRLATEGIQYEEHVMPTTVKADSELLVLAIANIVANAADAMAASDHKRITVHTELEGNWVALSITDTGPGLSPRDRENLFKPFYTTKPSDEGLGLGLALSAEYLAAMGARIQGGNAPAGGARFCIALPLVT